MNIRVIYTRLLNYFSRGIGINAFKYLMPELFYVNSINDLKDIFNWKAEYIYTPKIQDENFQNTNINKRIVLDHEIIATSMRNHAPNIAIEIGTAYGETTYSMHLNSPKSTIYTINPPQAFFDKSKSGKLITFALPDNEIGLHFREKQISSIIQILENSNEWRYPNEIDFAFIDGNHDKNFVKNDILNILNNRREGKTLLILHDCNPNFARNFNWVFEVCSGVDELVAEGLLKGPFYCVKDSFCLVTLV